MTNIMITVKTKIVGLSRVSDGCKPSVRHGDEVSLLCGEVVEVLGSNHDFDKYFYQGMDDGGELTVLRNDMISKVWRGEEVIWDRLQDSTVWGEGVMPSLQRGSYVDYPGRNGNKRKILIEVKGCLCIEILPGIYTGLKPELIQGVYMGEVNKLVWKKL